MFNKTFDSLPKPQVQESQFQVPISYFIQNCKKSKPFEMDFPFLKNDIAIISRLWYLHLHRSRYLRLGNVEQNKKPLNLDNYRGITTAKLIFISFYGSFDACKLSCVICSDDWWSGVGSLFERFTVSVAGLFTVQNGLHWYRWKNELNLFETLYQLLFHARILGASCQFSPLRYCYHNFLFLFNSNVCRIVWMRRV